MALGNIIAKLRNQIEISQRQLADILGVSNGAIAMWETNKRQPDLDMLKKIANFFNVSTDYLLEMETNNIINKSNIVFNNTKSILKNNISEEDIEWLSIIHKLPEKKQIEFKSKMEGYLECYDESATADQPRKMAK